MKSELTFVTHQTNRNSPGMRRAGRGNDENPRGGPKKGVNRLLQKFDTNAQIVIEIFLVYHDVLKKSLVWFPSQIVNSQNTKCVLSPSCFVEKLVMEIW